MSCKKPIPTFLNYTIFQKLLTRKFNYIKLKSVKTEVKKHIKRRCKMNGSLPKNLKRTKEGVPYIQFKTPKSIKIFLVFILVFTVALVSGLIMGYKELSPIDVSIAMLCVISIPL